MAIVKARQTSKNAFLRAADHGNIGYIGTDLYACNGTDNSTVFNDMYKSTNRGRTWLASTTAGWSIRNSAAWHCDGTTIKQWGGRSFTANLSDSWSFDGTTYTQISAAMTGFGSRSSFGYGFDNGFYYTLGGGGETTVIKSSDLVAWTDVAELPAQLAGAATFTMAKWNGFWWILAGYEATAGSGQLWKASLDFQTFEHVLTNTIFEGIWSDLKATDDYLLLVCGNTNGANQKGNYYCATGTDPAISANWIRFAYEMTPSHATPLYPAFGNIYSFCGNMFNESWEFVQIDKVP